MLILPPPVDTPSEEKNGSKLLIGGEDALGLCRIANATLSHLSYGPTSARGDGNWEMGTGLPAYKSRIPGLGLPVPTSGSWARG